MSNDFKSEYLVKPSALNSLAVLSPAWPPSEKVSSGIVSYTAVLRSSLAHLGVRTFILTNRLASGDPLDNQDVIFLEINEKEDLLSRLWNYLSSNLQPYATPHNQFSKVIAKVLTRLNKEFNVQLLEMEESFGWASTVSSYCSIPVVSRLHGPWFLNGATVGHSANQKFDDFRINAELKGILASDGISSPSQDVLDRTRRYYGLELPDAVVIPNPIAIPDKSERWDYSKCDPNLVLFVGRFDRHKGGDLVLEAFTYVLKHRPQSKLIFVGPNIGLTDIDGRRWNISDYIHKCFGEYRESVTWVDSQPPHKVKEIRRMAFITVIASRYENAGYAIQEAMAMGCPIVSSSVGGIPEQLEDRRSALFYPSEDVQTMAHQIIALLDNPQLACKLGMNAFADCCDRFDPIKISHQTLEFYHKILSKPKK